MGMVIDIIQGSEEELDYNDTEKDQIVKPSHKPAIDRDIDKIERKRDNPKQMLNKGPEKKKMYVEPTKP
jgi:hypothetical protein